MKKTCIIGLLVAICGIAQATTVTPTSIPDMVYSSGYEWGISNSVLGGAKSLSSASFTITTTVSGTTSSTLYIDLIGGTPVKVNGFKSTSGNSETGSDFWASKSGYQDNLGTPTYGTSAIPNDDAITLTFYITGQALIDLNYDLSHNNGFNIGFDPNCTYYSNVTTMSFSYSTPDTAATVLLLGASLLGLEVFRRKFVPAKNQA